MKGKMDRISSGGLMSQRIALIVSVGLTAFVLVFIGAAIHIGRQAQSAAANPTLDPQVVARLQAREAAYQAMIAQANAQLQAAGPAASVPSTLTPEPTAAGYPVSPELAANIALSATPGSSLVQNPVLISFQGAVAYEVTLNTGRVYVDANSGQILFNGADINSGGGGSGLRGDGDNEGD
jgi:uncharacterized membrane protein YkoI